MRKLLYCLLLNKDRTADRALLACRQTGLCACCRNCRDLFFRVRKLLYCLLLNKDRAADRALLARRQTGLRAGCQDCRDLDLRVRRGLLPREHRQALASGLERLAEQCCKGGLLHFFRSLDGRAVKCVLFANIIAVGDRCGAAAADRLIEGRRDAGIAVRHSRLAAIRLTGNAADGLAVRIVHGDGDRTGGAAVFNCALRIAHDAADLRIRGAETDIQRHAAAVPAVFDLRAARGRAAGDAAHTGAFRVNLAGVGAAVDQLAVAARNAAGLCLVRFCARDSAGIDAVCDLACVRTGNAAEVAAVAFDRSRVGAADDLARAGRVCADAAVVAVFCRDPAAYNVTIFHGTGIIGYKRRSILIALYLHVFQLEAADPALADHALEQREVLPAGAAGILDAQVLDRMVLAVKRTRIGPAGVAAASVGDADPVGSAFQIDILRQGCVQRILAAVDRIAEPEQLLLRRQLIDAVELDRGDRQRHDIRGIAGSLAVCGAELQRMDTRRYAGAVDRFGLLRRRAVQREPEGHLIAVRIDKDLIQIDRIRRYRIQFLCFAAGHAILQDRQAVHIPELRAADGADRIAGMLHCCLPRKRGPRAANLPRAAEAKREVLRVHLLLGQLACAIGINVRRRAAQIIALAERRGRAALDPGEDAAACAGFCDASGVIALLHGKRSVAVARDTAGIGSGHRVLDAAGVIAVQDLRAAHKTGNAAHIGLAVLAVHHDLAAVGAALDARASRGLRHDTADQALHAMDRAAVRAVFHCGTRKISGHARKTVLVLRARAGHIRLVVAVFDQRIVLRIADDARRIAVIRCYAARDRQVFDRCALAVSKQRTALMICGRVFRIILRKIEVRNGMPLPVEDARIICVRAIGIGILIAPVADGLPAAKLCAADLGQIDIRCQSGVQLSLAAVDFIAEPGELDAAADEIIAILVLRRLAVVNDLDRAPGRLAARIRCDRDRRRADGNSRDKPLLVNSCDLLVIARPCYALVIDVGRADGRRELLRLAAAERQLRLIERNAGRHDRAVVSAAACGGIIDLANGKVEAFKKVIAAIWIVAVNDDAGICICVIRNRNFNSNRIIPIICPYDIRPHPFAFQRTDGILTGIGNVVEIIVLCVGYIDVLGTCCHRDVVNKKYAVAIRICCSLRIIEVDQIFLVTLVIQIRHSQIVSTLFAYIKIIRVKGLCAAARYRHRGRGRSIAGIICPRIRILCQEVIGSGLAEGIGIIALVVPLGQLRDLFPVFVIDPHIQTGDRVKLLRAAVGYGLGVVFERLERQRAARRDGILVLVEGRKGALCPELPV